MDVSMDESIDARRPERPTEQIDGWTDTPQERDGNEVMLTAPSDENENGILDRQNTKDTGEYHGDLFRSYHRNSDRRIQIQTDP